MIINVSKYNEVSFNEVKNLLKAPAQIIKSPYQNGVYLGSLTFENSVSVKIYSDDEVRINNVTLPLAKAEESYFDHTIEIN